MSASTFISLKKHHSHRSIRRHASGFTLVEMLVSLVLSSIIFVSAYQVISNLIQYQVRYAEKSDRQLDRLLIKGLINQILSKGLHENNMFYRAQKDPLFKGKPDTLQIVSRAFSDHFDQPGYRVYKLYVKDKEFFVAYNRYDKESVASALQTQTSGINIEDIAFEYYQAGEWLNEWREDKDIPQLIKVRVTLPDSGTLEWVTPTGAA